jgi:hypothetical protein
MPRPQSEAQDLHLERARDHVGTPKLLGTPTIGGGAPGPGVIVEGVIEVK